MVDIHGAAFRDLLGRVPHRLAFETYGNFLIVNRWLESSVAEGSKRYVTAVGVPLFLDEAGKNLLLEEIDKTFRTARGVFDALVGGVKQLRPGVLSEKLPNMLTALTATDNSLDALHTAIPSCLLASKKSYMSLSAIRNRLADVVYFRTVALRDARAALPRNLWGPLKGLAGVAAIALGGLIAYRVLSWENFNQPVMTG